MYTPICLISDVDVSCIMKQKNPGLNDRDSFLYYSLSVWGYVLSLFIFMPYEIFHEIKHGPN